MTDILTWYESINDEVVDIDASIQKIQDSMFTRNPEKYGDFLKKLWKIDTALKIMMIPGRETRVELFKCVYYAMRLIDDVVDWDTVPPLPLDQRKELLDSILNGDIQSVKNPLYKALTIKIQELSAKIGMQKQMTQATHEIIISMNYDLDRIIDDNKTRKADDLHENFHKMDITGTIVWTAIIFWIDPRNAVQLISPLWEASRIMYNLRDFGEDIIADLINIPEEELEKFSITPEDLDLVRTVEKDLKFSELPQSIKKWFCSEIEKIWELLSNHTVNMQQECDFIDSPYWLTKKLRNIFLKKNILAQVNS